MLKFPTQLGVEIYPNEQGQICLKQPTQDDKIFVEVRLSIGQLRSLIKNSDVLIEKAELAIKESRHAK